MEFQGWSDFDSVSIVIVEYSIEAFTTQLSTDAVGVPIALNLNFFTIPSTVDAVGLVIVIQGGSEFLSNYSSGFEPPEKPRGLEFQSWSDFYQSYDVTPVYALEFNYSGFESVYLEIYYVNDFSSGTVFEFGSAINWADRFDYWKLLFDSASYQNADVAVISKSALGLSGDCKAESILFAIVLRIQLMKLAGFAIEVMKTGTFFKAISDRKYLVLAYRVKVRKVAPTTLLGELTTEADRPLIPDDL